MISNLPVQQIIRESIHRTWLYRMLLLRLCWPYALLAFATSAIMQEPPEGALSVLAVLVYGLFGVLAAVNCHRVFLLPEADIRQLKSLRWGRRETRFLLNVVGITIIASFASIPSSMLFVQMSSLLGDDISEAGFRVTLLHMLLFLPVYYVVARWSLILPDAALEQNRTLSWAWQASKGYGAQLMITIFIVPMLFALAFGALELLFGDLLFFQLLFAATWIAVAAVEICLLSLCYAWINAKGKDPDTAEF